MNAAEIWFELCMSLEKLKSYEKSTDVSFSKYHINRLIDNAEYAIWILEEMRYPSPGQVYSHYETLGDIKEFLRNYETMLEQDKFIDL